jgi:hypothetical protein
MLLLLLLLLRRSRAKASLREVSLQQGVLRQRAALPHVRLLGCVPLLLLPAVRLLQVLWLLSSLLLLLQRLLLLVLVWVLCSCVCCRRRRRGARRLKLRQLLACVARTLTLDHVLQQLLLHLTGSSNTHSAQHTLCGERVALQQDVTVCLDRMCLPTCPTTQWTHLQVLQLLVQAHVDDAQRLRLCLHGTHQALHMPCVSSRRLGCEQGRRGATQQSHCSCAASPQLSPLSRTRHAAHACRGRPTCWVMLFKGTW